jgi:hypothetical protein
METKSTKKKKSTRAKILCLSLFISIINDILFSLHSSSTAASISFFSPTSTVFS